MSDASDAYAEAEHLIAKAKASGATNLSLDNPKTHALTELPAKISTLTTLTLLTLRGTRVSDLRPLASLNFLNTLYLGDTKVTDLRPISGLTSLTWLGLNRTQISDLSPLSSLTALTSLYLDDTKVADLRPLLPLTKLATEPNYSGLSLENTPFARLPEFIEIAAIEDPTVRARQLFDRLKDWEPTLDANVPPDDQKARPNLPTSKPAPAQALVTADAIEIARGTSLLAASDPATRARKGWQSLKSFRDSFASSFQLQNYAPLPAILASFDFAMGDSYDTCEPIDIGVHGLRLIAQSQNQALLNNLPTGADSELIAFAAAISLFVDRFPDWQAYKADAPQDRPDVQHTAESKEAYVTLDGIVVASANASPDYKAAFHDLVAIGSAPGASEIEARGMMAATRELARALSENLLYDAKSGKTAKEQAMQMANVGQTEWPKIKYYTGGFVLDNLGRSAPSLRNLSKTQPRNFGWVVPVLDYFALDDKPQT